MPRDGSNIYHRPAGTDGVPNFPIESSKYNAYVADVEQDLNLPRPIVAGGTGATSADGALTNLSAEKAAQIVTNWDSTVWMAGSYYAATTATGIAPVTGHAFAGIAYVSNATVPITDMVLEATDVTDSANPDKYIRTMAAGVWGPWTRLNPNVSSANLGEYTFNNQVTFPPAAGQIRFNNATENSTTEVFISHLTATGFDNTTQITTYLTSGVDFAVQDKDEGNKYKVFTTTAAVVLSGGDFRVTVVLKIAGLDVVTTQRMLVTASGEAQRVQQRQLIYAAPFDALAYNGMQVNGSMEVTQERAVGSVTTAASAYLGDVWRMAYSGTMVLVGQIAATGTTYPGFFNAILISVSTAQASLSAGDYAFVTQGIEGYRVSRLAWGTANAQPITIGFWTAHKRTGVFSGSVRNGGFNRTYAFTYTQAVADTPQFNVVTIPGDTTGTWATDNTAGINLTFSLGAGTTWTAPSANTWAAGNFQAAPGQVNAVAATTDFFRLTGVVVLPGIEAPSAARSPLIMRPLDQELVTCKRYWQQVLAGWQGYSVNATFCSINWNMPVHMRSSPTTSLSGTVTGGCGTPFVENPSIIAFRLTAQASATGTVNFYSYVALDARL